MIAFDVAFASGSGLWQAVAWSDALLAVLSAGLLGMGLSDLTAGITGRLSGDDEADDVDELGDDGDFMGDGDEGDDEFGDLDGWEDDEDEFDDFGESEGALDEIEPRLDELENELSSVSSTMGTVRSESEAINESVEDMEDNIRKLLEIYEMVTRGVNPFVDDVEGSAGMGGSFGLFDGDGSDGGGADDLDSEIADADADSFFDDDWEDEGFEDDDGFDDDSFDEEGFDEEFENSAVDGGDDGGATDGGSEGDSSDGGKTFDQLKSEYEDGDAEWDDEETVTDGAEAETEDSNEGDGAEAGSADASETVESDTNVSGSDGGELGDEGEVRPAKDDAAADGEASTASTADAPSEDSRSSARSDGKPYLPTLPDGFGTELLVIEWLSYLRSCSSTPEALRAIRYYETIGWVGEPAAESLAKLLTGLADGDGVPIPSGGTQLTVDHHTQSLRYIGRLGGTEVQIERLDWAGPPRQNAPIEGGKKRGIQR